MFDDVVICGAKRSPVGTLSGRLGETSAIVLGVSVVQAVLAESGVDPVAGEEVIVGNVLGAGLGQNIARQIQLNAGLSQAGSAFVVNQVCGSGLRAVALAASAIASGQARCIIAGGSENMSQAPYLLPTHRRGARLGHDVCIDSLVHDGLWDAFGDVHMAETAENLADRYQLSRADMDAFAAESQQKAEQAQHAERFREEIVPIEVRRPRAATGVMDYDEHPRAGVTAEALAALKPAFRADGRITAGNASGVNDGAAFLLLADRASAQAWGLPILAHIRAAAVAGVDPAVMGIGPVPAIGTVLQQSGWQLADIDLLELNEAFAAQALAVLQELDRQYGPVDRQRVNVNGGAIALGHPIGASGARIAVTLLHEMRRRQVQRGLASLCIGGGMGIAVLLEGAES